MGYPDDRRPVGKRRSRLILRWWVGALVIGASLSVVAPGASASTLTPTPVIVDTDIFSDADDTGALATAFALQIEGEDQVIAITINRPLSRSSVATKSWRCAAAIAQYYDSPGVPLGADLPDNGTQVGAKDFLTPCAALASPSTPPPASAVSVMRRALVSEPDHSVVIVCTGYQDNLDALLNSPADSISPLSGSQLITQKVKQLEVMGGRYPSGAENNFIGDPAAAADVAANWPTGVAYLGYEVGANVYVGASLDGAQPANSPVRVAYDSFAGPGNSAPSWDLDAVYAAIRPADPSLSPVGPGQNSVDSFGDNTFTAGSGNEHYAQLNNASALAASLETLLDVLPPPPLEIAPPTISGAPAQGRMLSAVQGSWSNSPSQYGYQWERCDIDGAHCQPLTGATGQSYLLGGADVDFTLRVLETASNVGGGAGSPAASAATTVVMPPLPVIIAAPSITGSARVGQTLTDAQGSWSNAPTQYAYQWERCDSTGANCQSVTAATGPSYTVADADIGSTVRVLEAASNAGGAGSPALSAASAVVTAQPPVTVAPPSISGVASQGRILTEQHGTWLGSSAPTAYTYQWERCDATGANCRPISDATQPSYVLLSADVGATIRVLEIAQIGSSVSAPGASLASAAVKPKAPGIVRARIDKTHRSATFRFTATSATAATLQCELRRRSGRRGVSRYHTCGRSQTFTQLATGDYVLYVRTQAPHDVDSTPTIYRFTMPRAH